MNETIQHHEADSFLEEVLKEPGGESVYRCIECGICSYVCPTHRPLAQLVKVAKAAAMAKGVKA